MTNEIYTAVEAKHQFGKLIDEVQRQPITITKHNRNIAVVLSAKDIDDLSFLLDDFFIEQVETGKMTLMQALSNQAIVYRDIKQAEEDFDNGKCIPLDENFVDRIKSKSLTNNQ